ncbi:hypothetical protein K445DRAFT_212117 [Daldinia sp. EC12]|nr:hypothetical protein K445DRAFT_212117 [Daldinia sp. EC12]
MIELESYLAISTVITIISTYIFDVGMYTLHFLRPIRPSGMVSNREKKRKRKRNHSSEQQ